MQAKLNALTIKVTFRRTVAMKFLVFRSNYFTHSLYVCSQVYMYTGRQHVLLLASHCHYLNWSNLMVGPYITHQSGWWGFPNPNEAAAEYAKTGRRYEIESSATTASNIIITIAASYSSPKSNQQESSMHAWMFVVILHL